MTTRAPHASGHLQKVQLTPSPACSGLHLQLLTCSSALGRSLRLQLLHHSNKVHSDKVHADMRCKEETNMGGTFDMVSKAHEVLKDPWKRLHLDVSLLSVPSTSFRA